MLKRNLSMINCVSCGKRGDKIASRNYITRISDQDLVDKVNETIGNGEQASLNSYLCQTCKAKFRRAKSLNKNEKNVDTADYDINNNFEVVSYNIVESESDQKNETIHSTKKTTYPIKLTENEVFADLARPTHSHRYCILCKRENKCMRE